MKKFYLFAAAAVLLTACVKTQNLDEVATIDADETAVSFDVYTARATKAGKPQEITTAKLQAGPGFGVFAYYTDNSKYDQYVKPNFMYNQQVTWKASNATDGAWVYEPVKYWPNETGDAAASDDKDYVTFFAYAPYVTSDPASGAIKRPANAPEQVPSETELQQKNITGMTNNNTMGDPKIKYIVDWNPETSVDLLWGVQKSTNNDINGLPFLNQLKPTVDAKTSFNLKHALAKLNVIIDAHGDGITELGQQIDGKTRIYVRSITFEGFAAKGALNLKNTTPDVPQWMDYAGIDNLVAEPVTIYDGRKDGKEGQKDGKATREKVIGLNPKIVQSAPYYDTEHLTPGVTNTMVNLFKPFSSENTDPIFVIPNGDPVSITIVYDVETQDKNLATYLSDGVTHGSTIENTISKKLEEVIMEAGKAYQITLHLGMTSVKVEATVEDWATGANSWVDLPINS